MIINEVINIQKNKTNLTPTIRTSVLTHGALQMQTTYLLF